MIRHCVLCRFRDDVSDDDVAGVYAALDASASSTTGASIRVPAPSAASGFGIP